MREEVKKDTVTRAGRVGQREIVCHYLEISSGDAQSERACRSLRSALARRYLATLSLTDGSIRENSGFHGEKLASHWAPNHLPAILFLSFGLVLFEARPQYLRPAQTDAAQTGAYVQAIDSAGVPKAPEPALDDRGAAGKRALCCQARRQYPAGRPALSFSDVLPDVQRTERSDSQGQRRFPRHFSEGRPAGDRSRTAACADRREVNSGASAILKCGPSISPESWRQVTTEFASSATGAKSAATPWSSISRTATAA